MGLATPRNKGMRGGTSEFIGDLREGLSPFVTWQVTSGFQQR